MKKIVVLIVIFVIALSCKTAQTQNNFTKKNKNQSNDTIRIANDELEYEVIIFDPNFSNWLLTQARPRSFYTEFFLVNNNRQFVPKWNYRVSFPQIYNPNLYLMQIDYDNTVNYGFEVNYLLYNYFIYFQREYNQKL